MARIKIKPDNDRDLTSVVFLGKVTADTIINALKAFYGSEITTNVLWDFSDCDVTDLLCDDLTKLIETAKSFAHLRQNGKSALVGPSDLAYGLGRMYATLTELDEHSVSNGIFRTVGEALAWLDSK